MPENLELILAIATMMVLCPLNLVGVVALFFDNESAPNRLAIRIGAHFERNLVGYAMGLFIYFICMAAVHYGDVLRVIMLNLAIGVAVVYLCMGRKLLHDNALREQQARHDESQAIVNRLSNF